MNQKLKRFDFAIFSKNDDKIVQLNRIVLFFVMIVLIIAAIVLITQDLSKDSDKKELTIYFTNPEYNSLVKEIRHIKKSSDDKVNFSVIENKAELILNYLIFGSVNYENRSLIPIESRIKNLWNINNTLHINFTKEFITEINTKKIKDNKLIIQSIVMTLFNNIKEIKNIRFYVEDNDLRTFNGTDELKFIFRRKDYITEEDQKS